MTFNLRIAGVLDRQVILQIEKKIYGECALSEDVYVKIARQRNIMSMVVDSGNCVIGHLIYELHNKTIEIYRLVIAEDMQRRGIGTNVINILKNKLNFGKKHFIHMLVREHNLLGQLFLRNCGFVCKKIINDNFSGPVEDGYLFEYALPNLY